MANRTWKSVFVTLCLLHSFRRSNAVQNVFSLIMLVKYRHEIWMTVAVNNFSFHSSINVLSFWVMWTRCISLINIWMSQNISFAFSQTTFGITKEPWCLSVWDDGEYFERYDTRSSMDRQFQQSILKILSIISVSQTRCAFEWSSKFLKWRCASTLSPLSDTVQRLEWGMIRMFSKY